MARFVRRDENGKVMAVFAAEQPDAVEMLPDRHPEVVAFLMGADEHAADLVRSDLEMARVIEDVIELLIQRNVLQITDFHEKVRERLLHRREARNRLARIAELIPPEEDDIL